jgi:hypothetical protein
VDIGIQIVPVESGNWSNKYISTARQQKREVVPTLESAPRRPFGNYGVQKSAVGRWFGKETDLELLPWERWRTTVSNADAEATLDHVSRSPNASIEKARHLLGYAPRDTTFQAVRESVEWLVGREKSMSVLVRTRSNELQGISRATPASTDTVTTDPASET